MRCLTWVGFFENAVVLIESDSLILKSDSIVRVLQNSNVVRGIPFFGLLQSSEVIAGPSNDQQSCVRRASARRRFLLRAPRDYFSRDAFLLRRHGRWHSQHRLTTLPADENAIVEFAPHHDLPALFEGLITTIRVCKHHCREYCY